MKLTRFILYYFLFAVFVASLAVGMHYSFSPQVILAPYFWLLYAVVSFLTLIAYILSDFGIRKGGEISIYSLMGGLFIKLFACLVVVAVLIIKFPENKMITALNFFSLYFLFTAFEVICLLRNLRDQNKT